MFAQKTSASTTINSDQHPLKELTRSGSLTSITSLQSTKPNASIDNMTGFKPPINGVAAQLRLSPIKETNAQLFSDLQSAIDGKHANIVATLLQAQGDQLSPSQLSTLLHLTIKPKNLVVNTVSNLLAAGANVNTKQYGTSPLKKVASTIFDHAFEAEPRKQAIEVAKMLIQKGPNTDLQVRVNRNDNFSSYEKDDLCMLAATVVCALPVLAFVSYVKCPKFEPLLSASIKRGFEDLAGELIAAGASVDKKDRSGNSPLAYAIEKNSLPLVTQLLDKGANTHAKSCHGVNAQSYAARVGNPEVYDLIKARHLN